MITNVDKLRTFIAENKTDRAIQELKDDIKAYPHLQNMFINIAGKFSDIRNKKISGLLADSEEMRFKSEVNSAVLQLLDEIEQKNGESISGETVQKKTVITNTATKNVFISYNHHDIETANKLKEKLNAANIDVVIDSENMQAGEDIKDFIEKCVRETGTTISLISKNSLLSAWVAMESINTFYHEKTDKTKKYIACFIDDDFFKRDFTDNALDHIDGEIKEIQGLITIRMEKNRSIRDLQNELTRFTELRNNMDEIIRRLRECLCIDIRGEKLENNFNKITEAVNS
jgi:hypothetical protein